MKIKKLLKTALITIACLSFTSLVIVPATPTYADYDICTDSNIPDSVKKAQGCSNAKGDKELQSVVTEILKAIIAAAGLVAVIFIIIGGINYMTSAGDAQKVEKGKKTIIYAAIGLVICALAFAIVNWVILGALGQGDDANTQDQNQTPTTGFYQLPIA